MWHSLGNVMKAPVLSDERMLGRWARFPLRLIPPATVVPILWGPLRGKRWVAGSGIHRCWLGFYEREKLKLIARELRPGSVFYDVGAHVGIYTILASSLVGDGKVFAFEPVPRNVAYLKKHLVLNRISNVAVHELAVSDHCGMASFHAEQTGFMGHLSNDGGIAVLTATLDSLVKEGRILPPSYIKMDIEGAELMALRGARECIHHYRPMIFLATHSWKIQAECCQLLKSWDYQCRSLPGGPVGELGEIVATFSG